MLRGLVMVIMALGHVWDYIYKYTCYFDLRDLEQTNAVLFLIRKN